MEDVVVVMGGDGGLVVILRLGREMSRKEDGECGQVYIRAKWSFYPFRPTGLGTLNEIFNEGGLSVVKILREGERDKKVNFEGYLGI